MTAGNRFTIDVRHFVDWSCIVVVVRMIEKILCYYSFFLVSLRNWMCLNNKSLVDCESALMAPTNGSVYDILRNVKGNLEVPQV